MSTSRLRIINSVIVPFLETNGFYPAYRKKTLNTTQVWSFVRKKNGIFQEIIIEIVKSDTTLLCLWSSRMMGVNWEWEFSNLNEFKKAVDCLLDVLQDDLIIQLNQMDSTEECICDSDEIQFYNNYNEYLTSFCEKNVGLINDTIVERFRLIDERINLLKRKTLNNVMQELFEIASFYADTLLLVDDTFLRFNETLNSLIVVRRYKNPAGSYIQSERTILSQIYKIWKSSSSNIHTIRFLKQFLTNEEIMKNNDIRNEMVRLGLFDLDRRY